jgi:hypothetical protein
MAHVAAVSGLSQNAPTREAQGHVRHACFDMCCMQYACYYTGHACEDIGHAAAGCVCYYCCHNSEHNKTEAVLVSITLLRTDTAVAASACVVLLVGAVARFPVPTCSIPLTGCLSSGSHPSYVIFILSCLSNVLKLCAMRSRFYIVGAALSLLGWC